MVVVVMLRPDILRHARDHAEEKPGCAIEPAAVKQTPVAAFVHQRKNTQSKQRDQQHCGCGDPEERSGTQDGHPPEQHQGHQRRQDLRQPLDIIGLAIPADHHALVLLDEVDRQRHGYPLIAKLPVAENLGAASLAEPSTRQYGVNWHFGTVMVPSSGARAHLEWLCRRYNSRPGSVKQATLLVAYGIAQTVRFAPVRRNAAR
jgi:hypothetical protein